jgi:hypothetical protein
VKRERRESESKVKGVKESEGREKRERKERERRAAIGCGPCGELRADLALLRWRLLIAHGDKCSECRCRYNAAQTRCLLLINRRVNFQRVNLQRVRQSS